MINSSSFTQRNMAKKSTPSRTWYYFRMGWSLYFAFVFAAINTMVVTYYLAIERYPPLLELFPSFIHYVVILSGIGIPVLTAIGYAHFKKTPAFKSETEIAIESNPFQRRMIINTELILRLNQELIDIIMASALNEKISQESIEKITRIKNEIKKLTSSRTLSNSEDLKYLHKMYKDNYEE